MICCETFKEFGSEDFSSWGEWVDFVNRNTEYALNKSKAFDWYGKFEEQSKLISYHPYWKYHTRYRDKKNILKRNEQLLENIKKCPDDTNEDAMVGSANLAASNLMGAPVTKSRAIKLVEESICTLKSEIITYAKSYKPSR